MCPLVRRLLCARVIFRYCRLATCLRSGALEATREHGGGSKLLAVVFPSRSTGSGLDRCFKGRPIVRSQQSKLALGV